MRKKSNVIFSIKVTKEEKQLAEQLRARFKETLDYLHAISEVLDVLKDSFDSIQSIDQVSKLSGVFVQLKKVIRDKTNDLIENVTNGLAGFSVFGSDSILEKSKDMIVESVKTLRIQLIELIKELSDSDNAKFVENIKNITSNAFSQNDKISKIIKEQLFKHIDENILERLVIE